MKVLRDRSGMALVTAMCVLLSMTAIATALYFLSDTNFRISGAERRGMEAYYSAQAGITDVIQRLKTGVVMDTNATSPTWSATVSSSLPIGGTSSVTVTHVLSDGTSVVTDAYGKPMYRLTSTGSFNGNTRVLEEVVTFDPVANVVGNPVGRWGNAVTACGGVTLNAQGAVKSYNSSISNNPAASIGNNANIWASGNVTIAAQSTPWGSIITPGSITYNAQAVSIGNATAGGSITLNSQAQIQKNGTLGGNAAAGPGVGANISVGSQASIAGSAIANGSISIGSQASIAGSSTCTGSGCQQYDSNVPAVASPPECNYTGSNSNVLAVPSGVVNGGSATNNKNLSCTSCTGGCSAAVSGAYTCTVNAQATLTLPGGTASSPALYYFDNLTLSAQANLYATGYVQIYVAGKYSAQAQTVCEPTSLLPPQLLLYVGNIPGAPATSTLDLEAQSTTYGAVYAPGANVTANAQYTLYGALITGSGSSTLGAQGTIYYDQALQQPAQQSYMSPDKPQGYDFYRLRECFYGFLSAAQGEYAAGSCAPHP